LTFKPRAADAPFDYYAILDYTGNDDTVRELAQALNVDEQYVRAQPDEPALAGKRSISWCGWATTRAPDRRHVGGELGIR